MPLGHALERRDSPLPEHDAPAGRPAAADAARLALSGLSHRFGHVEAIVNANLSVAPGEIVSLLGPSGCGKTTLLRIAAGIERQTSGDVWIDGVRVAGADIFVPAEERSLGLVFQDFALFPHLTVLQNALYGLRGLPKAEARRRARAALARLGLEAYEGAFPHMLSGGEQQRVALVRALLPGPRAMLLDEPFSGLDRGLRAAVRDETIAVLRETGTTALMVTHDPLEALEISDRVALMLAGRIVQVGSPEEVYRRPLTLAAARFFSDLSVLPARVAEGAAATPFGSIPVPAVDGTAIVVAFRPEAFYIAGDGDGVEARVDSAGFSGDGYRLTLRVEGLGQTVAMRAATAQRPRIGDRLRIGARLDTALLFTAE